MATRPTKDWQDAPSTATPITAAALEDLEDREFDYTEAVATETLASANGSIATLDATVQNIHEVAPSIEYWGARPSETAANNKTFIQNAVNASKGVRVPYGLTYNINGRISVPTRTTIHLDGNVTAAAGTWPAETGSASAHAMFFFVPTAGATEGHDGGIIGRGTLDCAGLARYGTDVESWDNIEFARFSIENAVDAHMHFRPGIDRPDGVGTSVDCDACDLSHLNLGYSGAAPTFPPRGILMRDAGGNDSEIRNLKANGFKETTGVNDVAGGWGIELRNSGRVKIVSSYIGDNGRRINGAVLIRTEEPPDEGAVYHERPSTIRDLYVEAGHNLPGGSDATWIFAAVKISVAAGITVAASREHEISGLEFQYGNIGTAANARRLWLANSGTSGMISNVKYVYPKDHLSALGQILISNGSNNNLIELMGAETTFVDNTAGGTGNKIRNVLGSTF